MVLEIKGKSYEDTDAKHQAARRWVSAVNHWGMLGEWDFLVCREPQQLGEEFSKLLASRKQRVRAAAAVLQHRRRLNWAAYAPLGGHKRFFKGITSLAGNQRDRITIVKKVFRVVLDTNQIVGAGTPWLDRGTPSPDQNISVAFLSACCAHTGLYCGKIIGEYLEKLVDKDHPPARAVK